MFQAVIRSLNYFSSIFFWIIHKRAWIEGCRPPIFASSNRHNVVRMFFEILTSQCRGVGDDEVVTDCTNGSYGEWTEATASGVATRVNTLVGVADSNDSRPNHQGWTHSHSESRAMQSAKAKVSNEYAPQREVVKGSNLHPNKYAPFNSISVSVGTLKRLNVRDLGRPNHSTLKPQSTLWTRIPPCYSAS